MPDPQKILLVEKQEKAADLVRILEEGGIQYDTVDFAGAFGKMYDGEDSD